VSSPDEPTAEQIVAELRKTKVGELLVHTCSLLASVGYGKLADETRDLADARLAIDALKALEPHLPADAQREVQSLVASLQLAYAEAAAQDT
jgi:hypothetical protein